MENRKHFFAVDLGATSGRTIIGILNNGKFELEEITRFDNSLIQTGGHFYWDIFALYDEILKGLKEVSRRGISLTSIGIDTWGVDFVCVGKDGAILRNPLSYRDPHTFGMMEKYFEEEMSKKDVYDITGIQFINFNSIFQLYTMRKNHNSALENAKRILFLPDALGYMLTGKEVCEYTIASTSEMLDPRTKKLDEKLLASVGLTRDHFGKMVFPATVIGSLTEEVQKITGLGSVPVVAVAGHDTGSAVAAVPAQDEKFAYLSSGTWSLMGIESQEAIINEKSYALNFTNEGGVEGKTRFLKNICGMWLYERCRKEWPDDVRAKTHLQLQEDSMKVEGFKSLINPDDPTFANPSSMIDAIQTYCRNTHQPVPQSVAEICRCIFDSLALRYRQVMGYLREFAPFDINVLHIVGGGSKNYFLDQFTANSCNVTVLAGPQEGTAIGNIMLQAKAAGLVKDIWEMRKIIANSIEPKRFEPQDPEIWDKAYQKYLTITK
ncbi:MAG: rhamnulokinase [Prevotella sp.]|jgi:rhamnulokinase|nr:rhamnulokinase [Prevotella sp.]